MTEPATIDTGAVPAKDHWPRPDGSLVDCREKLRQLRENQAELSQTLRDCFDDAVLMGVDPAGMRDLLRGMVDALRDPRSSATSSSGGSANPR